MEIAANILGFNIGLWRITESAADLLSALGDSLDSDEISACSKISNLRRRQEFLATRLLIAKMLGHYPGIHYDEAGKPSLPSGYPAISISHAVGMAAVMLGDGPARFGIDIERITPRVLRIQHKFLSESDISSLPNDDDSRLKALYIHWCAKEAMYKAVNIRDWDYQNSYALDNYVFDGADGVASGRLCGGGVRVDFSIRHFQIDDYIICVASEKK